MYFLTQLDPSSSGVGKCDSERQATRAFWWTNSSAQRKMNRFIDELAEHTKIVNESDEDGDLDAGEDSEARSSNNNKNDKKASISRRKSVLLSRHKTRSVKARGLVNPIYGIGVVFYLDHYGRIQGIMTWGLQYSDRPGGSIYPQLLEYIRHLIATNAGVSALDAEENHQLVNVALGKASQQLVALAVQGRISNSTTIGWHNLDGPIEGFSTPLYRYTEVSNSKNKTVNVLKRKDGSGLGVLGEGLYVRDDFLTEEERILAGEASSSLFSTRPIEAFTTTASSTEESIPTNIPTTMYPITVVPTYEDSPSVSVEKIKELHRYLAVQRWWETNENRARPGKEDPIWLRPGDERKNTSGKQAVNDAYRRVMFAHRTQ